MSRKLIKEELQAELNAVMILLEQSIKYDDPLGKNQFSNRKNFLENKIREIDDKPEKQASLVIFFGGQPVLGSRGIEAEFAGSALGGFQELISKAFAEREIGRLGERGPVPLKESANLMITELARGSFGFVLDELNDQDSLFDTKLKEVVEQVASLIEMTAAPEAEIFEDALESLDQRTLIALKDFFKILDSNNATLRLVEEQFDYTLDEKSIKRARERTESSTIEESEEYLSGDLHGFLPEHKKFELMMPDGTIIYGSVSQEAADQYTHYLQSGEFLIGMKLRIKVRKRIVRPLNRPPRVVTRLLEFII